MLSTILAILPWALTVGILSFIIYRNYSEVDEDYEEDYDEYDHEHEVVHVAVYKDKAYWVYDNVFYESDTTQEPDFTTARPVDTMDLPSKRVKELMSVLDELKQYRKD